MTIFLSPAIVALTIINRPSNLTIPYPRLELEFIIIVRTFFSLRAPPSDLAHLLPLQASLAAGLNLWYYGHPTYGTIFVH